MTASQERQRAVRRYEIMTAHPRAYRVSAVAWRALAARLKMWSLEFAIGSIALRFFQDMGDACYRRAAWRDHLARRGVTIAEVRS